jgi:hypothetical protein
MTSATLPSAVPASQMYLGSAGVSAQVPPPRPDIRLLTSGEPEADPPEGTSSDQLLADQAPCAASPARPAAPQAWPVVTARGDDGLW